MKKQVLPSINVPMSEKTGDVSFPWYMFFKKMSEKTGGAKVYVADTETGEPGTDAKVENIGTDEIARLKFTIPQGDIGPQGPQGIQGPQGERGDIGPYITNCITEIPQDIKLELADGVLTLKAGSKVYIPNGSGIFDTYIIPNDLTYTRSGVDTLFLFIRTDTYTIGISGLNSISSGSTDSLAGTQYHTWYDTANNLIKRYATDTNTPDRYDSLPIAIIKVGETQIESIDQVFNGFGYIGSTVFVLPGVKGLIPNGRNEDGTLKSNLVTSNKVLTNTYTGTNSNLYFGFVNNAVYFQSGASISYNAAANTTTWNAAIIAKTNATSGKITEFESKPTFHAVDYSDFEELDNSAVHKTGDETVAGTKTFTAPYLQVTNAAGTGGSGIKLSDSNGKGSSELVHYYTGGNYYTRLVSRNTTANKYAYIEIIAGDDGNMKFTNVNLTSMTAPTPSSASNDTNIATTAWVRDLFEALYPVGAIYVTSSNSTTCPLASIVKKSDGSNSTWSLVSSGKALWTGTGSNGNSTIAAGLPNITAGGILTSVAAKSGATTGVTKAVNGLDSGGYWNGGVGAGTFDASKSNSIYGNSTTVQPPAYVVNVWRRTE